MRQNKIESDINGFRQKASESRSFSELGRKLGYKPSGGIHKFLKQKVEEYQIDTSHFNGHGWAKGKTRFTDSDVNKFACGIERPWEEIFIKGSSVKNSVLLRRLIVSGKKEYKCESCGIKRWKDKPLRIQLDHKNGDNTDNREENLMVICPNCHTQTPTYSRGKRRKTKKTYTTIWWETLSLQK